MTKTAMTRRHLLGTAGLGLAAAVTAPRWAFASGAKEISVQIWGSTWTGSVSKAAALFEERTGIKVKVITQASAGEGLVKLQTIRA